MRDQAFHAFLERHHAELSGLAHLLSDDPSAADDLAADALTEVWTHWDRVTAAGDPTAYARGIVANLTRNWIRRQGRARRGLQDLRLPDQLDGWPVFAVSTLGCPGLPLPEVGALLRQHGVGAVQLRCAADEPVHVGLSRSARRRVRRELRAAGLTVIGLATYVRLAEGAAGLAEHLDLARDLGAPALRLMPGDTSVAHAAEVLAGASARAHGTGVRLLVETHDAFLRGADLRRLLDTAGILASSAPTATAPPVGAIWDALHPWRAGESPAETLAALAGWLAEIQIKDVASPGNLTPLVPGTGAVPGREVLARARAAGFSGPVVLEHEARWHADAAPIDDAIEGALRVLGR